MNTRKSPWKTNIEVGKQYLVMEREHDWGLRICQDYRDVISEEEFININWLCMAYANNERLDADIYHKAMGAIRRIRESVPSL